MVGEAEGTENSVKINVFSIPMPKRKEVLDRGVGLHITHSHPGPYKGADLDSGIPTSLSMNDVKKLCITKVGAKVEGKKIVDFEPLYESITADCTNGSRMTLTLIDKELFKNKAKLNTNRNSTPLNKKWKALDKTYKSYINDCKDYVNKKMKEYTKKEYDEKIKQGENIRVSDLINSHIDKQREFEREFANKNFEKYLEKDIANFKDMGIELTVGWLK